MKDKQVKKFSMKDQLILDGYDPSKKEKVKTISNVHASKYTNEYYDAVRKYNANLKTIDLKYKSVVPLNKILIRPYLYEPQVSESGLYLPYKQVIPVATKSGQGTYQDIESDFPYSPKAVVISAPENSNLKSGDIVFLSRKAISLVVLGVGVDAELRIENGFVHPDSGYVDLPKDLNDPHYGYVMVEYFNIEAKINE